VANVMTSYSGLRDYAISRGTAAAGPIAAVLLALLSGLVFWCFIARRASNVAKWLLVVFSGLSLFQLPEAIAYSRMLGWIYGTTFAASGVALLAALVMLFRADAIEWLTARPPSKAIDPKAFD
jgi:hypothetical protein